MLLIVWSIFIQFFYVGLRKTHVFCNSVYIGRSGSSKVVYLEPVKEYMRLPIGH